MTATRRAHLSALVLLAALLVGCGGELADVDALLTRVRSANGRSVCP